MSDNEGVEKETTVEPQKKKYIMTEARRLAWQRCRERRQESIKKIDKNKTLKKLETKEQLIKKQKEELLGEQSPPYTLAKPTMGVQPEMKPEESDPTLTEVKPVKAIKPKKKKQVVIEEESEDSESSVELIIKKKEKVKRPVLPCEARHRNIDPTGCPKVTPSFIFV